MLAISEGDTYLYDEACISDSAKVSIAALYPDFWNTIQTPFNSFIPLASPESTDASLNSENPSTYLCCKRYARPNAKCVLTYFGSISSAFRYCWMASS